jgi:hypothetical protein
MSMEMGRMGRCGKLHFVSQQLQTVWRINSLCDSAMIVLGVYQFVFIVHITCYKYSRFFKCYKEWEKVGML